MFVLVIRTVVYPSCYTQYWDVRWIPINQSFGLWWWHSFLFELVNHLLELDHSHKHTHLQINAIKMCYK